MRHDVTGGWAELREEITEREARPIRSARAHLEASLIAAVSEGFDPEDPKTWSNLPVEAYQDAAADLNDVLISTYVKAWSFEGEPSSAADVLPRRVFEELAGVCDEADRAEDLSPDGATDPKAPTDAESA